MTSKLTVQCNGNYRVPVYKGTSSTDMGDPTYVGPGNNVNWEAPLHTLKPGEFYFVGAEEQIVDEQKGDDDNE